MTVLDNAPRDQYTATSGQTVFPYTFEIAAAGDIKVLQNGTILNQGAGAGEYAVSGVGVDTGGNITLVTGATTGDIITIYRDMAYERLTAYTNAGDFLAADVNNDFDRLWLALQQNNSDLDGRVLIAPNTDPTSINMTIPDKAARLDKFLKFNATTGNPEVISLPSDGTTAAKVSFTQVGTGAIERTVDAKLNESVSVKDFGAVGDGVTDDTAAIQAAFDSGAKIIYIPKGIYSVTSVTATDVSISGDGAGASIIRGSSSAADVLTIGNATDFCTFEKFRVDFVNSGATGKCIVLGNNTQNLSFRNLETQYGNYGIYLQFLYAAMSCDFTNVKCSNHLVWGFYFSFSTSSPPQGEALSFRTCYATSCARGFSFIGCHDLTMSSCAVDSNTVEGISLRSCRNVNLISSHFEGCNFTGSGIYPDLNHLIKLISCNTVQISGISSSSNSATTAYYILGLYTDNQNIQFTNQFSSGNTNERFMYIESNSTATNTDIIISNVDETLTSVLDGDAKIRNLNFEHVYYSTLTNSSGQIVVNYPTVPDYLGNPRVLSFVDEQWYNYYVVSYRFGSYFVSKIKNGTNGSDALVANIPIQTMLIYRRN